MPIQTITAQLQHPAAGAIHQDCYCFDAAQHNLVAEPFVPSATAAIAAACAALNPLPQGGIPTPPAAVELRFSSESLEDLDPDPDSTSSIWVVLNLLRPVDDGHDYDMLVLEPGDAAIQYSICYGTLQLWLCPVLLDYFPSGAPERLFVQITPAAIPACVPSPDAHS